ncbi:MAG TPA: division/cell wall cluster transcriptional repressor MraZ [Anaeromyxobacteraceae bacterium]|nr:division/cell wall cluster transcriptional repressor MraZ [Anaeromyxobacteraceae bacterium]
MFFGSFAHTIDAKGRTSLPAKFREALAAAGEPKIVLVQYPYWRAVQALPLSEWKRLEEKLMQASPHDRSAQATILKFFSSAHEVDLDVHGRVLVPPNLRQWAGLSKDVVWAGMGRHVLLWDKATLDAQQSADIPADQVVDFWKA